jgi:hypothetical protein
MNFQKLMKAFEKRTWTKETCFLFRTLLISLFDAYNIRVDVHIKTNIDGDGKFEIEFLEDEKSRLKEVENPKQSLWERTKSFFKVIRFIRKKL